MLYLVRHGRPVIDRTLPPHEWPLDPAYADDVRALRPRLPVDADWFSSPEPKALDTARLLTDRAVEVVPDLREHERHSTAWVDDFAGVVRRAFEHPDRSALAGWEPLVLTRQRVVAAVAHILGRDPGREVVLVGHGTAWTLLRAAVLGEEPDLDWWSGLAMPDVASCEPGMGSGDMLTP
ncbi:MAG TPA: histidine phosphatase family protein [Nocardioides sp.]|nr:histidine phosphatase family protein [Nocardioides sp.]